MNVNGVLSGNVAHGEAMVAISFIQLLFYSLGFYLCNFGHNTTLGK